jgi:NADH-quinone oxidoreductase subunit C
MDSAATLDILRQAVPGAVLEPLEAIDMPALLVDREHLVDVCRVLRDDARLQYAFLADVTAVDWLPAELRFEVVYHLACLGRDYLTAGASAPAPPSRLRLKVRIPGDDAHVPTVSSIWPTAGWPEREVFDLFGIRFEDHPDLRRILMPDDWEGHPLRRDYPVQVNKETASSSPLQLTPEEFARNVRADRDQATRQSHLEGDGKHEH